jgi:hypothetical protein
MNEYLVYFSKMLKKNEFFKYLSGFTTTSRGILMKLFKFSLVFLAVLFSLSAFAGAYTYYGYSNQLYTPRNYNYYNNYQYNNYYNYNHYNNYRYTYTNSYRYYGPAVYTYRPHYTLGIIDPGYHYYRYYPVNYYYHYADPYYTNYRYIPTYRYWWGW